MVTKWTTYHVNQHCERALPLFDQLGGIVLIPLVLVAAKVALKGFLAPRTVDGVCNWRKS